jgi:asparaginyl-tRNA synthetase
MCAESKYLTQHLLAAEHVRIHWHTEQRWFAVKRMMPSIMVSEPRHCAGEMYACAMGDIYTFGPTFRAENSNTARHLAEFWMIEPEMAFANLDDDIACAEAYLQHCVRHVLDNCKEDLRFFDSRVEKGLIDRLEAITAQPFARVTYTKAVDLLLLSGQNFEYPVEWGSDLQSEHERWLTEKAFDGVPVVVTDYPKGIKAFYMRLNDDGKTVAAMDVLVPRVGELIGGSQREDRMDVLIERLTQVRMADAMYTILYAEVLA